MKWRGCGMVMLAYVVKVIIVVGLYNAGLLPDIATWQLFLVFLGAFLLMDLWAYLEKGRKR